MDTTLKAKDVAIGFHPDGYRIDKTASAMNRYTKWDIVAGKGWCNPKAVCFHSIPELGWIAVDKFDWSESPSESEIDLI